MIWECFSEKTIKLFQRWFFIKTEFDKDESTSAYVPGTGFRGNNFVLIRLN